MWKLNCLSQILGMCACFLQDKKFSTWVPAAGNLY